MNKFLAKQRDCDQFVNKEKLHARVIFLLLRNIIITITSREKNYRTIGSKLKLI